MARRKQSTAETLFALANVLTSLANIGTDLLGAVTWTRQRKQIARREQLHEQGQILKNRLAAEKIAHEQLKQQVTANREIKTGLDIDKQTLEIRRLEHRLVSGGILPPDEAQFYHAPKVTAVE